MERERRAGPVEERVTRLEDVVAKHLEGHELFEKAIEENTRLTQSIADNTSEMVALLHGIKGLRSLVVWAAPMVAAFVAVMAYLRK